MMDKKKLSFEVDASHIDIKPILRKDFLELSMKAISSANPNRNGSWFTEESMERSKASFVNKPILGYFENDDFVSHNGDWKRDSETEMDYWDTLGKKGERILGVIRESDEVKIIKDKKGLSWIAFTCMLWTQYSFKQVKRLIKDAKRAAKNGGAAKNISVEVDITDYDILPNGVMKINEFNLIGVTILGSRNGIKVEPGIEDAELSVVDIMGKDVYERQTSALRLAYERLETPESEKEEKRVKNEELKPVEEAKKAPETECLEGDPEEICPVCHSAPCQCEEEKAECLEEGADPEPAPAPEAGDPHDDVHDDPDEPHDGDPEDDHDDPKDEDPDDEDDEDDKDDDEDDKDDDPETPSEPIEPSVVPEPEPEPEEKPAEAEILGCDPEKESLKCECEDLRKQLSEAIDYAQELAASNKKLASEYDALREELAKYGDYEEIKNRLTSYEHKEFMGKAEALVFSAKLDDEKSKGLMDACESGDIADLDDLKVKVAVAAFDSNALVEETSSLIVPVSKPDTTVAFAGKAEKNSKRDCWSVLADYAKN